MIRVRIKASVIVLVRANQRETSRRKSNLLFKSKNLEQGVEIHGNGCKANERRKTAWRRRMRKNGEIHDTHEVKRARESKKGTKGERHAWIKIDWRTEGEWSTYWNFESRFINDSWMIFRDWVKLSSKVDTRDIAKASIKYKAKTKDRKTERRKRQKDQRMKRRGSQKKVRKGTWN